MKCLMALFTCFILGFYSQANAYFLDGNEVYSGLDDQSFWKQGYASGYILGVVDAYSQLFIIPPGATRGQITDVVKNFMNKNPQFRHYPAADIVFEALKASFPLKKKEEESVEPKKKPAPQQQKKIY